jgi:hypothetical protein
VGSDALASIILKWWKNATVFHAKYLFFSKIRVGLCLFNELSPAFGTGNADFALALGDAQGHAAGRAGEIAVGFAVAEALAQPAEPFARPRGISGFRGNGHLYCAKSSGNNKAAVKAKKGYPARQCAAAVKGAAAQSRAQAAHYGAGQSHSAQPSGAGKSFS